MTGNSIDLERLFAEQMAQWPQCRQRYEQLAQSRRRTLQAGGREYLLTYNPGRERSAKAEPREDKPCFLCPEALPPQQLRIEVETLPARHRYWVAVNPYPITDHHFTLVSCEHERQTLRGRLWDMAYFADLMPDYLIFFNGARAGASAPGHAHFQAVPKRLVPMLQWGEDQRRQMGITTSLPHLDESDDKNVVTWTEGSEAYWLVIERKAHRPSQYSLPEGDPDKVVLSPAALEFCGLVPLCREEDYDKLTAAALADMLGQCRRCEPWLHVGVMEGQQIRFSADERVHAMNYVGEGQMRDVMDYGSNRAEVQTMSEYWCHTEPFTLEGVTIGKQFHWQQREDQVFRGSLHIIARQGRLHAINLVPVEEYLQSVISSEMAATNSLELLKAHAIISRSWVMRQLMGEKHAEAAAGEVTAEGDVLMKYWDHTDHQLYDVCADDHCQRYQGITRQASPLVAQAVRETRGVVLVDAEGSVCDARFSKCCGGRTELFSTCWQERDYHYLQPVDDPYCSPAFIETLPGGLESVLAQVLNGYDQTTVDYHDWEVRYSPAELSALIEQKLELHLGTVRSLEPVERGASGRIKRLRIVGTQRTVEIGKELLIRKALSETHLLSSWFEVGTEGKDEPVFVLRGHGWGHGVGLCQIGAAAMALKGFTAEEILMHYYKGAKLSTIY